MIYRKPVTEIAISRDSIESPPARPASSGCVFLVAGRLVYRKGHDFLLDALARLPQELEYTCRIVGDGPEFARLKDRCEKEESLSGHVVFTGKIPFVDMEREYAGSDVLIMPSIRETTGSVILEAFSKGKPVITINQFGGAALIDQNTGWLYDGNTKEEYIEGLKNAVVECITHPEEVKRRGENALKKAEKYTWEEKNKFYQMLYGSLLESEE